jgi:cell pole-organizing protein PopZ
VAAAGECTDKGEDALMTQPAKSQEPSMEEILASIRRIIADDDASKTAQRPTEAPKAAARPAAPVPRSASPEPRAAEIHAEAAADPAAMGGADLEDQSAEILDLTESMAAPMLGQPAPVSASSFGPGPAPQFRKIEGYSDVSFDEAGEKPAVQRTIEGSDPRFAAEAGEAGERGAGGRAQLLSSATSAAVDSAFNALAQTVLVQNARTLEDLVREMLRPMLKTWLDDNLPGMVERLVRAEIERVARGR